MNSELKQAATQTITQVATHPKTAWLTVFMVNIAEWYVEWVSPVIIALTSILSFVIMILLVRYHWINTDKLKLDIELQIAESKRFKELEKQLQGVSDRKSEREIS